MSDLPPPSPASSSTPVPPPPPRDPRAAKPAGVARPVAITDSADSSAPPVPVPGATRRRRVGALVGLLAGAAAVTGGLMLLSGGDDPNERADAPRESSLESDPASATSAAPATSDPVVSTEPTADSLLVEPDVTEPAPDVTEPEPDDTTPEPDDTTPDEGEAPDESVDVPLEPAERVDAEVPESKATVRNGQIFFEGAVPTAEDAERIVGFALEIFGPQNVFDNYVIDPRAGDPSDGNITVEDSIRFATDSAVVPADADPLLFQGLALLNLRPEMTVEIVGHTDSRGTPEGNQALSLERAQAVLNWYVDKGIDPARFAIRGAGQSQPIAPNETADGRRLNRRIQFFLENVLG